MYDVEIGEPGGANSWKSMWGSFVSGHWITVPSTHMYEDEFPISSWETDIFSPYPYSVYKVYINGYRINVNLFGCGTIADLAVTNRTNWRDPQTPGSRGASFVTDDAEWTDLWIDAVNGDIKIPPGFSFATNTSLSDPRGYRHYWTSYSPYERPGDGGYWFFHNLEAPMVPVCMMKRMGSNPYYTVGGTDVSGTGAILETPYSYPYNPSYTPPGIPLYAPNALTQMPINSAAMATNGLSVSLYYFNTITVPESSLIPPAGFLDSYVDVPGSVWVRVAFSSDGAGADATSQITKTDLVDTGGGNIKIEIPISIATIDGNEYIDEIDLYWRRPHAYFAADPFPTTVSEAMNKNPWYVIMRGNTGIGELKVEVA